MTREVSGRTLRADDIASAVLRMFVSGYHEVDDAQRSAWSRFLMCLLHRHPEAIERLRDRVAQEYPAKLESMRDAYGTLRGSDDPTTFDEFMTGAHDAAVDRVSIGVLQGIMDSQHDGEVLNRMSWGIIRMSRVGFPLLTSDRPIVMTNGLNKPDSHVIMPISPHYAFIAAASRAMIERIAQVDREGRLAGLLNDRVVRQARRYVWATDDSQLRFVENRLGTRAFWSPWE